MATMSASTFKPLSTYVNVRIQQGVPIVDADVNELDDIRKFELRAFLKWFVGDGVPEGNNGFQIVGGGLADDFTVKAGAPPAAVGAAEIDVALRHVGRIIVDGLDLIITADVRFAKQPLHETVPGAAALAAKLGVPVVAKLTAPAADGVVCAYLDLWERLVTPDEKPELIHPGLGVESCARTRREWVVRVRTGLTAPVPGDPDHLPGHTYSALATVQRRKNDAKVQPGDVTDRRQRRLLVPPATLVEDVLGTDPDDYRQGRGRPPISLREAINALLRGELPSTPDKAVDSSTALDVLRRGFLLDKTGGLVATWYSDRVGGVEQVFATRMDLADMAGGFVSPPQQVSSGAAHLDPHTAVLPNGDMLVAYQTGIGAGSDIAMKRAPLGGIGAAPEIAVAATAGVGEATPFITVTGQLATVFFHLSTTNRWQYRRWNHTTSAWADAAGPVELSGTTTTVRDFHAAVDTTSKVWAAFRFGGDIRALQLDPASGAVANETTHDSGGGAADQQPFVLCSKSGDVWVFWHNSTAGTLVSRRFRAGVWEAPTAVPGTGPADRTPSAVEDVDGGIWLFWTRGPVGAGDLFALRRDPATGGWGTPRQLTTAVGDDSSPFALVAPDTSIWIFWSTDRDGNANIYYKRLVTAV